ncbi:MAG: hypothetical protein U1E73_05575 [Planctomycetota bacterium]
MDRPQPPVLTPRDQLRRFESSFAQVERNSRRMAWVIVVVPAPVPVSVGREQLRLQQQPLAGLADQPWVPTQPPIVSRIIASVRLIANKRLFGVRGSSDDTTRCSICLPKRILHMRAQLAGIF